MFFAYLETLYEKMDNRTLQTSNIRQSIREIATIVGTSFGQAQKAINVLIKYHSALYHLGEPVGSQLDCPLDSLILEHLNENISLFRMNEDHYAATENKIQGERRVDFDRRWDEQRLREEGLLNHAA